MRFWYGIFYMLKLNFQHVKHYSFIVGGGVNEGRSSSWLLQMWSYNAKMRMLSKIEDKIFWTWEEVTCVRKYHDTLHIQKHTIIYVKVICRVVQVCPCVDSDCLCSNGWRSTILENTLNLFPSFKHLRLYFIQHMYLELHYSKCGICNNHYSFLCSPPAWRWPE
jgi:hypothetical protein